jgi:hypothetical protein
LPDQTADAQEIIARWRGGRDQSACRAHDFEENIFPSQKNWERHFIDGGRPDHQF